MSSMYPWIALGAAGITAIAGLGGVWLGSHLTTRRDVEARAREGAAQWAAIKAELSLCSELARAYLGDTALVPSYRMPIVAFENAFPRLLSAAAANPGDPELQGISDLEVRTVLDCYREVESFNRGLDYAHEADGKERAGEVGRAHLKASHLIPGKYFEGEPTRYDFAMATVAARLGETYLVLEEIWEPTHDVIVKREQIWTRLEAKHHRNYLPEDGDD